MSNWTRVTLIAFVAACGGKTAPAPSNTTTEPPKDEPAAHDGGTEQATGQICGTRGASACPTGQFCNYAPGALCGAADAPGHCEVPPEVCTMEYAPVCGCDGKTYGSACTAAGQKIGVKDVGECPKP